MVMRMADIEEKQVSMGCNKNKCPQKYELTAKS